MGGRSSKMSSCDNENNQIQQLKKQLQEANDKLFQCKLQKSKTNFDPENDNNIYTARVGGKKKSRNCRRRTKGTRKNK
jgi:DNA-binding protein YbaB